MTKRSEQDALMIRYLLGTATEEEQTRLEEQFFTDDEQYQQLQAVEDELRYEYAQGGLSAKERKSFESRFLKSAEDRRQVELARAVLEKVHEAHAGAVALVPGKSATFLQMVASLFVVRRLAFATAALLIVLSAGSLLMLRTFQLQDQLEQLQARQKQTEQDAQKQIAAGRQQQDQLNQELEKERARASQQVVEKRPPAVFGFVLVPGLVRGAEGPKRLVIPSAAGDVLLQLDVKANYTRYRAELQNLDGDVLWSQNVAQASVTIPSRLLTPGDYVVVLKGIGGKAEGEDAGEFYFQVAKK